MAVLGVYGFRHMVFVCDTRAVSSGTMPGPSFRGCNDSVFMGSGPTWFRFCHERSCDLFYCCSFMKKACTQSNTRYIKCNCGAMLRTKQSPEHSSIHTLTLSDTLTLTYWHIASETLTGMRERQYQGVNRRMFWSVSHIVPWLHHVNDLAQDW